MENRVLGEAFTAFQAEYTVYILSKLYMQMFKVACNIVVT